MASDSSLDAAIDHLYQLPLGQFVAARKALARQARGEEAARVRALAKPNVIAWALNQLYWSERAVFDRLIASAGRLRAAQADVLRGRRVDLREVDAAHRQAVRDAVGAATRVLGQAGHDASPDAVRALMAAFEALPWTDRPGRLVRPPTPTGFAALAGLPLAEHVEETDSRRASEAQPKGTGQRSRSASAGSSSSVAVGEKASAPRVTAARSAEAERALRREQEAASKTARAAVADARRTEADAASRLRVAERQVEAALKREGAAREALAAAQREHAQADEERRSAAATLEHARAAVREAAGRLEALDRH